MAVRAGRLVLAGALAVVLLLLAAAHAPLVRARLLAWAVQRLAAAGLQVEAASLSYNLVALRADVSAVRVAAMGAREPFFSADRVRVDLGWSSLWGPVAIQSIEVDRPSVTIRRAADGATNLPSFSASNESGAGADWNAIERVTLQGLAVRYEDAVTGTTVNAPALHLNLQRAGGVLRGGLRAEGDIAITAGTRASRLTSLQSQLAMEGTILSIGSLEASAPEGDLHVEGRADLDSDGLPVTLAYRARIDAARAATWLDLADEPPAGIVTLSGDITGPIADPAVAIAAATTDASWPGIGAVAVQARGRVTSAAATLDALDATIAGGTVHASGHLGLDDAGVAQVSAQWRDLAVGDLLRRAVPQVPIDSRSSGEGDFEWRASDLRTLRARAAASFRSSGASAGALPLSGTLEFRADAERWTLGIDQMLAGVAHLSGTAAGRLGQTLASTTLGGQTRVAIEDIGRSLAALAAAGYRTLDDKTMASTHGSASADVTLAGTIASPGARGSLRGSALAIEGSAPVELAAAFDATTSRVTLDGIEVTSGPNVISGSLVIRPRTGALTGQLAGDLPDFSVLSAVAPAAWHATGAGRVHATVGGTLQAPAIDGSLEAKDVSVAGQTFTTVRTSVRLADEIVTAESVEIEQPAGHLSLSGSYGIAQRRYTFRATAENFTVAAAALPLNADADAAAAPAWLPAALPFDAQLSGQGTLDVPHVTGGLQLPRVVLDGRDLGPFQAVVALNGKTVTLDGTLDRVPLAGLASAGSPGESGDGLEGYASLHVAGSGLLDDLAASTADLELRLDAAMVHGVPLQLDGPIEAQYAPGQLAIDPFVLRSGTSTLTASGGVGTGGALEIAIDGTVEDFLPIVRLAPSADRLEAAGVIRARLRAAGALTAPDVTAELSLTGASIAAPNLPPATSIEVRSRYAGGVLEITDARAAWQQAAIHASGRFPAALLGTSLPASYLASLPANAGPAHAEVQIASITPLALTPWVDAGTLGDLDGRLDVVATFDATGLETREVTGEISLSRAELELATVGISQVRPTRLRLEDGRLQVADWTWSGGGHELSLGGAVDLTTPSPALDLRASGALDLRMLGAFAPDLAAGGIAQLNLSATGSAAEPRFDGTLSLAGAEFSMRDPRFAITDLRGTATLSGDAIEIRDVAGSANGGSIEASGTLRYRGLELTGGTLALRGRGLALELPEHLRTEIDADLTFAGGDPPALSGRVAIARGAYREPISLTEQLLSRTTAVEDLEPREPGALDRVRLDVAVVSEQNVVVDNNYARVGVSGDLRIGGTIGEPAVTGRLSAQEGGDVFLGGRTYHVQRGAVDFTNPVRIEPTYDLALETRVGSYDVTLEIGGTSDDLNVSLSSPGLSQEDVVSLLLNGQLSAGGAVVETAAARDQLLLLLSGEFLGIAGRAVGLESVQVSRGLGSAASDFDLLATNTDPSARLTLTKALHDDVDLVFSQSLRSADDTTWIVSYRPIPPLQIRGTTEGASTRSYEFRHDLAFGGGASPQAGANTAEAAVDRRVAAVRFSGSLAALESELSGRIRLHAGDRFDVYAWQSDRDRLIDWYRARGYFEARVQARRADGATGEPTVDLEYAIASGPRTTLRVDGYALPDEVLARMRAAWANAVFDGFLLDDLAGLARRALVAAGYVQAVVRADVDPASNLDSKVIAVRIAPGPRFDARRIAVSGSTGVDAGDLAALTASPSLSIDAWIDPVTLSRAIERFYRARGYLSVRATVQPAVFEGSTATIPITVQEGPLYRIGRVAIEGVAAQPEGAIVTVLDLVEGSPYRPGEIEAARRRVETAYLRQGFNHVSVGASTALDEARERVDVAIAIDEGVQQVISSVEVRGAETTAPSTIARVVDLQPGTPADLREIFRAQKRLYDTSVFRRADVAIAADSGAAPDAGVQPVAAVVTIQELPRYRFRYGFRLTDEVGPVEATRQARPALVADLMRRNLFGRAISAGVAGQIERDRRLARGLFTMPSLFGLPVVTNLFATSSRQFFAAQSDLDIDLVERVTEFTVEQRFRPSTRMAVTYGYKFAHKHTFEPHPDPDSVLPPQDVATRVARFTGTVAWDTRDDASDAHRGWLHSSGMEFGSQAFGSDLRFIRYLAQQYYFRTIGGEVVLASGLRLGAGRGFGGQELVDKYMTGGGTSVRGFAENALGESDFFGPLGGEALLILNQEVRFPVFKWVRGVGFLDAGNVFTRPGDLSWHDLDLGTGAGLRVHSPFALFRLDVGVPVTRRDQEPRARWYFGLGQTF